MKDRLQAFELVPGDVIVLDSVCHTVINSFMSQRKDVWIIQTNRTIFECQPEDTVDVLYTNEQKN